MRFVASTMLCIALLASSARAQSWRVHAAAAGAHAVSGHQKDELGYGATASGAIEYGFTRQFGVAGEFGWVWLSEGDAPKDPSLAPLRGASALSGALSMRLRPFASEYDGEAFGPEGIWLAGGVGLANTDSLNRLFLDGSAGYDFLMHEGQFGLGPYVGLLHVSQPDDRVRPDDANILVLGVHAMFDSATPEKKVPSDRDRDGIVDELDRCPDDPEDKDGFEDQDGCPDDDNDKDGVIDRHDDCPMDPEDKDGFEDGDGCPDLDNDKDGLPDKVDRCPDEPEDKDGFEDQDGCPDDDNDKDGILDAKDLCPDEPETVNNYADHDGCPDEERVRVVGDKIVLDDRVHFRTNSHIIRGVSYPLLEKLSKLVSEHPEYTHISVEGHADSRGSEDFNQKLSQRRAESVLEFMVKHGVDRERLSATGYGSSRPLVDAKTEHAYLLNRRVEFVVTRKVKQVVHEGGSAASESTQPVQTDDRARASEPGSSDAGEPQDSTEGTETTAPTGQPSDQGAPP